MKKNLKENNMFYIDYVTREKATGIMKELYDKLEPLGLPGPVLVKSIVPKLSESNMKTLEIVNSGETISFSIAAAIRYIMSVRIHSAYCTNYNGKLLELGGFTKEDLDTLGKETASPKFSPQENALIKFACDSVQNPMSVDENRFNEVKSLGWSDEAMLVAVTDAADLVAGVTVFKVFQKK